MNSSNNAENIYCLISIEEKLKNCDYLRLKL